MSYKMPEVTGQKNGCFSKIPRYSPLLPKGLFKSTYQEDYLLRLEKSKLQLASGEILKSIGINGGIPSELKDKIIELVYL